MFLRGFLLCTAALTISACATATDTQEEMAEIDPRIGEEVDRICFSKSISGWNTVKGDRDAVILTRGVRERYRVEYSGVCNHSDFRSANSIGIDSRGSGSCISRGDSLLVRTIGDRVSRCFITQINRWDRDGTIEEGDDGEASEDNAPAES